MQDPILTLKNRAQTAYSMTELLRLWCEEHQIGHGPLRADFISGSGERPPTARAISALSLGRDEPTRLRQIVLKRGDIGLLEADNWYVPGRLPDEVNDVLENSDTPFGAALPKEHMTRKTLFCGTEPAFQKVVRLRGRLQENKRPILTVCAVVMLAGKPVAFVEERLRPQLITGMAVNQGAQSA